MTKKSRVQSVIKDNNCLDIVETIPAYKLSSPTNGTLTQIDERKGTFVKISHRGYVNTVSWDGDLTKDQTRGLLNREIEIMNKRYLIEIPKLEE